MCFALLTCARVCVYLLIFFSRKTPRRNPRSSTGIHPSLPKNNIARTGRPRVRTSHDVLLQIAVRLIVGQSLGKRHRVLMVVNFQRLVQPGHDDQRRPDVQVHALEVRLQLLHVRHELDLVTQRSIFLPLSLPLSTVSDPWEIRRSRTRILFTFHHIKCAPLHRQREHTP